MVTVNEKLAAEAVRRRIMLLRYGNKEAQDLIAILRKANPAITAAMLEGVEGLSASNMTPARLRALSRLVLTQTQAAYSNILKTLNGDMEDFGTAEADYNSSLLLKTIPGPVLDYLKKDIKATSWQQVLATLSSRAVMGRTIDQWFSVKLPTDLANSLVNGVQAAILQGTPSVKAVNQIRKSAVWGAGSAILLP